MTSDRNRWPIKSPRREVRPASIALGERLKIWRGSRHWSLRDLEKRSGVSNAYLSQIESGRIKEPSLGKLRAIAGAYGVSVSTLIGEVL